MIRAGREQQPLLANLLELYAHDFSEFHDLNIGGDGKFGYPSLPLYWAEPDRHPFLIKMEGRPAGLALIRKESSAWDMAEFFILRGYRRRGIGTWMAQELWRRFPGLWEVRVMEANVSAQRFWVQAISTFTCEVVRAVSVENAGIRWLVFSFESKPGS